MSKTTVRALIAALLLIATVLLGAGTATADTVVGNPGANGTSWTGGSGN